MLLIVPLSTSAPCLPTDAPGNTYKDPNPWPQDMVVEYRKYKAADISAGDASTRYWQLRGLREAEATALPRTSGRRTYTPLNLTPESHFELRPMAVDWKHKARKSVRRTHMGAVKCLSMS